MPPATPGVIKAYSVAYYTDPAGPVRYQITNADHPVFPDEAGYLATEITITLGNFLRTSFEDLLPYGSYGITKKAKNKVNVAVGPAERKLLAIEDIDKTTSRIVKIIK